MEYKINTIFRRNFYEKNCRILKSARCKKVSKIVVLHWILQTFKYASFFREIIHSIWLLTIDMKTSVKRSIKSDFLRLLAFESDRQNFEAKLSNFKQYSFKYMTLAFILFQFL